MSGADDIKEQFDLHARERAKDRQRIAQLEETIAELEARIEQLEDRAPHPREKAYQQMDRSDKATVIQTKLKQEAQATNGRASVYYDDVVRMFDGQPSAGHAYDLLELAAEESGFRYEQDQEGKKRLICRVKESP